MTDNIKPLIEIDPGCECDDKCLCYDGGSEQILQVYDIPLNLLPKEDAPTISFHDNVNKEVGRFNIVDGVLTFSGSVDASAQIFIDEVLSQWQNQH